mmetsp:Transcript_18116/g.35373  ORF Transcript_18116/g.35373 Transcript_18116/m.35373 type:complete len:324 (-) Transcript_18116:487-1458(-)
MRPLDTPPVLLDQIRDLIIVVVHRIIHRRALVQIIMPHKRRVRCHQVPHDLDLVAERCNVEERAVHVVPHTSQVDADTSQLLQIPVLCGQPRLSPPLLQQHKSLASVPSLKLDVPVAHRTSIVLVQIDLLACLINMSQPPRPKEVLPVGSVDLNPRHNHILAVGVDGDLSRLHNLPHDALIRRISKLHEGGDSTIRQMTNQLLFDKRLLHIRLVQPEAHFAALEFAEDSQESSAGARSSLPARPKALAHLPISRQRNMRCHPEDISLLAIHNRGVSHGGLETRATAEDETREGGDGEVVCPVVVEELSEGTADLVTACADKVD